MDLTTRPPAVAGYFYPAGKEKLTQVIGDLLAEVPPLEIPGRPRAVMVPHAGYRYSGRVAARAFALLQSTPGAWKKIVAIGPAHTVAVEGLAADAHTCWRTPLGEVRTCRDGFPAQATAHDQEHCLEVELPFLQYVLEPFRWLPLLTGTLDLSTTGPLIKRVLDPDSLLLISSDLSHFYDYDQACRLDRRTISTIESLDIEGMEQDGLACGKIPILLALTLARQEGWQCRLLDYRNSGDTGTGRDSVVGYASFVFFN